MNRGRYGRMGPMSKYEVRLVGKTAKLGDVAMVDIARLMLDVQTLVARAAGVAIRRRPKATGRWERTLEEATKLRLVKIKRGSVVLEIQAPHAVPEDDELGFSVDSLADLGWSVATSALRDVSDEDDPDVLVRLLALANDMAIGNRFDAVEFRTNGEVIARLDGDRRQGLRAAVERRRDSATPPPAVTGVLFEADFERHSARVRTQDNGVVELVFEEEQAAAIKEALRERSQFRGEVSFDPITNSVKSVRLTEITRFEQLLLGDDGSQVFWNLLSFDELVVTQGTAPIESFDDLRDDSLSEDEFEKFVDALR